jgi:hypothetical protein
MSVQRQLPYQFAVAFILVGVFCEIVGQPSVRAEDCQLLFLDDLFAPLQADESRDPWAERMDTDRHDYTQSARTVGRGVSQLEMGYTYYYEDTGEEIEQSHVTPEMMVRLGLTQDIELRIMWNYVWRTIESEEETANDDGAEDLRWGFKLRATEQSGLVPESAIKISFTAPSGGAAWTTDRVEFGTLYIYEWRLAERWTLAGSSGLATQALADFALLPEEPASDRFLIWIQSVALGLEITEKNTLYAEWFGEFSHALADEVSISIFNVGVDHYFTDNIVVDLRAGVGLNDESDNFFAGVGGGLRF